MTKFTYLDFDLLIEETDTGCRARVLHSPAGEDAIDFVLPFSDLELENFLLRIGQPRRLVRRHARPGELIPIDEIKAFGGRLFEAIFNDDVEVLLRLSQDEAQRQEAENLRLQIHLSEAPGLSDVP